MKKGISVLSCLLLVAGMLGNAGLQMIKADTNEMGAQNGTEGNVKLYPIEWTLSFQKFPLFGHLFFMTSPLSGHGILFQTLFYGHTFLLFVYNKIIIRRIRI